MPSDPTRGRAATGNPDNRFESRRREAFDDGWDTHDDEAPVLRTEVSVDQSRAVINYNQSPDVPFDRSINPYRGCEHGCIYCFARPTHAYLGFSPGLDFESRILTKPDAADILRRELSARGYAAQPIALGINTDAYQPVERRLRITREILEVLRDCAHPVTLVTKSQLIERDLDLLSEMASNGLVSVAVSLTTLDRSLARRMEPRAAAPQRRLQTIAALAAAEIPVGVLIAPVIPVLTDHELENLLEAARHAGARSAGYVLLRLPHEVKDLFADWLRHNYPLKAKHVLSRVYEMRGGRAYDSSFHTRMRGEGQFAGLLAKRFEMASRRLGFIEFPELDCTRFRAPPADEKQLTLW
jgi:DNA repair photolyase